MIALQLLAGVGGVLLAAWALQELWDELSKAWRRRKR